MAELTRAQRFIFGFLNHGNIVSLTEGLMVFYYVDTVGVSANFIAIANVLVACMSAYTAGNLSDRAKGKYRRKSYILVTSPIWAIAQLLRFAAPVRGSAAGMYYLITYAVEQCASQAQNVAIDSWGQELVQDPLARGDLYATSGIVSLAVTAVSLGLLAVPPAVAGVIGLVSILASSGLALLYLREGTAMEKRVFIPTVTNLSSVMWNTQFRLFIGMSVCAFFFNTLPTLLPFFLQFSMGLSEGQADVYYLVFIAVFVISGLVALLVIRKPLELLGTLKFGKMCLLAVSLLGYVALGLSYLSPIAIVVAFSCLGFFLTAANVVFSTISAECVDYDELLCGKKRASSYQAVLKPIATFIRVAGPSIPLALMSATGFKEAEDDEEDPTSTEASDMVIRLWCTAAIATFLLLAYAMILNFKIDDTVHSGILEAIAERERGTITGPVLDQAGSATTVLGSILEDVTHLLHDAAVDDISSKWDRNAQQASSLRDKNNARTPQATASARNEDENPIGMGMQQALVDDNFVSSAAQVYTKPLSSVTDPVTGQPVLPPPYAQVMEVIDNLTLQVGPDGFTPRLSDDEITKLRFLGYYFPRRLDLCVTDEGRRCILIVGWTRLCLAVILFMTALWQTVRMMVFDNVYGAYLMVFLLLIYLGFLTYQVLFYKGWLALSALSNNSNLLAAVRKVSDRLQENETDRIARNKSAITHNPLVDATASETIRGKFNPQFEEVRLFGSTSCSDLVYRNSLACSALVLLCALSTAAVYLRL